LQDKHDLRDRFLEATEGQASTARGGRKINKPEKSRAKAGEDQSRTSEKPKGRWRLVLKEKR